jgi:hypothetical protein
MDARQASHCSPCFSFPRLVSASRQESSGDVSRISDLQLLLTFVKVEFQDKARA